jgi:hypothetical protein
MLIFLIDILAKEYPLIKESGPLFDAFKLLPHFSVGSPSAELERWIGDIDVADPNDPSFDEDNHFEQWGHHQLSLSSPALTSWTIVGNVETACRLVAALVKTCKVAREICRVNERNPGTSFIADVYLDRIIETLWKVWTTYRVSAIFLYCLSIYFISPRLRIPVGSLEATPAHHLTFCLPLPRLYHLRHLVLLLCPSLLHCPLLRLLLLRPSPPCLSLLHPSHLRPSLLCPSPPCLSHPHPSLLHLSLPLQVLPLPRDFRRSAFK